MYDQMTLLTALTIQLILTVGGLNNHTITTNPLYCRTERSLGAYLSLARYHDDTCARCYHYMPRWAFVNNTKPFRYLGIIGQLYEPFAKVLFHPQPRNRSHPIFATFKSSRYVDLWLSCCKAAVECCHTMLSTPEWQSDVPYCPRTWDGWQCWPDTPADQMAYIRCPDHIYFKNEPPQCPRYAMKMCRPNGTWFVSKQSKEWTDYSHCGIVDSLRKRLYFHIITFAVSITALVPALVIFFSYKQLQVHRVTMHKNLFVSLLLNGVFVIIFRTMVMTEESDERGDGQNFFQQNGPGCKVLFVTTKYFRMTSYMWMFCEGFYLHKLIVAAFAEQKSLVSFYVIGWGFPIIPVGIYAILRKTLKDERCWVIPMETYEWVMHGPYLVSLALNLAFLCNIIRGLVTKIRATHPNEPSQYRKAVRATLVLVPLFGVHFFLDKYRPSPGGCGWMDVYIYFNFAIDGLQGFVVALIFCYLNGEVISLLKRSYQRYKLRHNIQGSFSSSFMGGRLSTSTHMSSLNDSASLGIRYPLRHFTRDRSNLLREESKTTELK
ncbi:calcitonin gene-related peptide type 1 receptor-like isoform X1 [Limulus polyphemus]|uniref:Calcitonin gene-related peptide type 1 receptor-like isoform X1 n=1 Tax=Limulus polyphemus TaxID=6850 RepID=A0ABM1SA15_LIMPO|nr:calcitonin gene-related peptide type 1 receptor-like isoform X1 [Limulus polyphemus]